MNVECCLIAATAAATAATGALVAIAQTSASSLPTKKENILTLSSLEFTAMLSDRYDEWFRQNLRCDQAAFLRLCGFLRHEQEKYELDRFIKEHPVEEKVACLLFFLGSQGGYRETTAAFAISKSWAIDVIAVFLRVLRQSLHKL
ncbi:hypothetical protein L914_04171 [Phytophthora nicotianae]|uniref:Uncharacterized protein n=1 Tax=Phytophthora nicotianae TaxID=4792 RepID=W2NWT6_PHYNI|nr:hypothetical protein L914_04171 [Phytophthora nicotianae]